MCLLVGLAACSPRPSSQEQLIEVCRPEGVAGATLKIGPLEVPHDKMVARLHHVELTGEYGISIRLAEEYAYQLVQLTRESLNTNLVLALDEDVIAEPMIRSPILDGRILIAGNFTRLEASEIVARLSVPCPPQRDGAS
ncbi:MAG: hypothetical protein MRY64_13370 [Hyphomonadaceae bacterium]|nr:hypothetical protein [Hyphomonadaceae bacterium]